ncbi:MAG: rhodanese-like domain-containing protein [Kineosporiaceae bacterium]
MPYAGDLGPREAYELLAQDPDAVLVDVRTRAEWAYVGLPDLASLGKEVVRVEWQRYPGGAPNREFLEELAAAGVDPERPVLFLCRSGVRSAAAAETASRTGFTRAYNVRDGFEGPLDADGHRGVRGWRAAGLPWRQS